MGSNFRSRSIWYQRYYSNKTARIFSCLFSEDQDLGEDFPNYYKSVADQKEIVRVFMGLQGAMYLLQPDVNKLMKEYLEYNFLWVEDREQQVVDFCSQNPLLVEIIEKFVEYDEQIYEIKNLPELHNIGAVQIRMGKIS